MTARRWLSGALAAMCLAAGVLPASGATVHVYRVRNTTQAGSMDGQVWCPSYLTAAGGLLWFTAYNEQDGVALWRSDGTPAGTAPVKSFGSNPGISGLAPAETAGLGDGVVFAAADFVRGRELWRSDGTADGTTMVKEILPGIHKGMFDFSFGPHHIVSLGQAVVFTAPVEPYGPELVWGSDGSEAGTTQLADVTPDSVGIDQPFTSVGSKAVFFSGEQVWATDGTLAGTGVIAELPQPPTWGGAVADGAYYFVDGSEIWRTDGSAAGTRAVLSFSSAPPDVLYVPGAIAGGLFIVREWRETTAYHRELWFCGFEGDDPRLVHSCTLARPDAAGRRTSYAATVTDLFFKGDPGNELWASDGTAAGTRRVVDPGALGIASIGWMWSATGGRFLLFEVGSMDPPDWDWWEPRWCTDGTAAGTRPVAVKMPNGGFFLDKLVALGARTYFVGRTGDPPTAGLWGVARVGVSATPSGGTTTDELGGSTTLSVVLESKPLRAVTVPVACSDPGEAEVSPPSLTFTPEDWDTPQAVTVTGLADGVADGHTPFSVTLGPALSEDPAYAGLDAGSVRLVNLDTDPRGIRRRLARPPAPRR